MRCFLGKIISFEAIVGVTAPSTCRNKTMVCLEDVMTSEGLFRDHVWIERESGYPKKGCKIKFHSRVRKQFSHFEGTTQIDRIGLSKIRRLEEV